MIIVKTLSGLEEILAGEIRALNAKNIQILKRAVSCDGDNELIYKINYLCRTALRVLKTIAEFPAENEDMLYQEVKNIEWDGIINLKQTFAVDCFTANSNITHSYYAALKTKDAIADYFVAKHGKRPSVDIKNPHIQINVHIVNNQCTLSLDSSGDSLHKRGYRQTGGLAPLNEVLAAGLIFLSGWDRKTTFLDPFCGSGTLLMEAAMMAQNIPAGYYRRSYCFENWPDYDKELWGNIKNEALGMIRETEVQIIGADWSPEALKTAKINIRHARLHKDIILLNQSFERLPPPSDSGVIIANPPYGERIEHRDITSLYKMIGDVLKEKYNNWNAWIISSDQQAVKLIGLRPSEKYDVFNGKIPCKFAKFEVYEGSRKTKKSFPKKSETRKNQN